VGGRDGKLSRVQRVEPRPQIHAVGRLEEESGCGEQPHVSGR
jgi:hypothetical protein